MSSHYRVLFCGNWGIGRSALHALLECSNVDVVRVYTRWSDQVEDPFLRQVRILAEDAHLPVLNAAFEHCSRDAFAADILAQKDIHFLVSCSFHRLLSQRLLAHPRLMAINLHQSLLPKFRGVKPLDNTIVHGDTCAGVTLHAMIPTVDAGDIILQDTSIQIAPTDTYGALIQRQNIVNGQMIRKFFLDPESCIARRRPQDHQAATPAPRLPFGVSQEDTVAVIRARYRSLEIKSKVP